MPSVPPPAYPSRAIVAAASAAATTTFANAVGAGSGRRAHCCPRATPDTAATIISATQTGPNGGVGAAARIGSAGMSPPNTVNGLNVASPTCALDPTATAAAPTITLGTYSTESTVKLSWPNTESVIAYSSCIVDQCTTRDPATMTPDSPINASTPAAAARTASITQLGSGDDVSSRRPTREPTPTTAPIKCTTNTPLNARNASGVCRSVRTDAASWMTARHSAAMSTGPPIADATTQRVTNQDALVVAAAVMRAVP